MSETSGLIMTPTADETVARLGEIAALREISQTLNRMGTFMQGLADRQDATTAKLAEMHTDLTVMKLQNEKIEELRVSVAELFARVIALELESAEDKGARKALATVREWSPFILGLLVAVFALIKGGLIHL